MDKRYIDKVSDYRNEQLLKLQAFTYTLKNSPSKRELGLIAQEVQVIEPLLVKSNTQGALTIDYERFAVALFSVVKDQHNQLDNLQREINLLKNGKKK